MSASEIVTGPNGKLTNVLVRPDGAYERLSLNTNAVLLQMFERRDEDGNISYERVFSIVCVDEAMRPTLEAEARRLMALES